MSVTTSITINLEAIGLREMFDAIQGEASRARLHQAMAEAVREATRDYLIVEAGKRHATADRLGAERSGHLEQAWRAVEKSPIESSATGATLSINVPGLNRAFEDVTIVPKTAKALTIPVDRIAYARRAGEFGNQLYIWKSKTTGNAFLAMRQADKQARPLLLYLLVRSVTQHQDRTLLPSDEQWQDAGGKAAEAWFQDEINQLSNA